MTKSTAKGQKGTKAVAEVLGKMLADTYVLYLKTQNFHWNVEGPEFYTLHKVFEAHYDDLAGAVDDIAERIRVLGYPAPGSFKTFLDLTCLKESGKAPSADKMVEELLSDHECLAKEAREHIKVADELGDQGTVDLLGSRIGVHEKTAWMLRAYLGK